MTRGNERPGLSPQRRHRELRPKQAKQMRTRLLRVIPRQYGAAPVTYSLTAIPGFLLFTCACIHTRTRYVPPPVPPPPVSVCSTPSAPSLASTPPLLKRYPLSRCPLLLLHGVSASCLHRSRSLFRHSRHARPVTRRHRARPRPPALYTIIPLAPARRRSFLRWL